MSRLYSLLAIGVLLLSACSHKDGDIDSRRRMAVVYCATRAELDGQPYYQLSRNECQQWHWNGNGLYRIDYSESDATYSESFYYDRKGRISRTTVAAYGLSADFSYNGRQLQSINIQKNNQPYRLLTFTHEKDQITQILQHDEETGSDLTYVLTWNDDNVSSISILDDESTTTHFTYDDRRNPYRDLYSLFFLLDEFNPIVLCKNNPLTANDHLYTYAYDGRYPTASTHTFSYTTLNTTTFGDCVISVTESRDYAYIK